MFGAYIHRGLLASGTIIALGFFVVQSMVDGTSTGAPAPTETSVATSTAVVSSSTTTTAPTTTAVGSAVEGAMLARTAVEGSVLARTGFNAVLLLMAGLALISVGAAIALSARSGDGRGTLAPRVQ